MEDAQLSGIEVVSVVVVWRRRKMRFGRPRLSRQAQLVFVTSPGPAEKALAGLLR